MCYIVNNKGRSHCMTYTELQITLLEMGLSIKDLATLLGMNPNSITNYKSTGIIPLNLAITVTLIANLKKADLSPEEIINEVKRRHANNLIENN
jgi:transcriptional regulator with XRE-family HTH domain